MSGSSLFRLLFSTLLFCPPILCHLLKLVNVAFESMDKKHCLCENLKLQVSAHSPSVSDVSVIRIFVLGEMKSCCNH
jgi:hypothetical protein